MKKVYKALSVLGITFVSSIATLTSTFAWFSSSSRARIDTEEGSQVLGTIASECDLKITDGSVDWKNEISVGGTEGIHQDLYPVSHDTVTKETVNDPTRWFYKSAVSPTSSIGANKTNLTISDEFSDYVYKQRFYFKSEEGVSGICVDSITLPEDTGISIIFSGPEGCVEFNETNTSITEKTLLLADVGNYSGEDKTLCPYYVDAYMYINGENENVYTENIESVIGKIKFEFGTCSYKTINLQMKMSSFGHEADPFVPVVPTIVLENTEGSITKTGIGQEMTKIDSFYDDYEGVLDNVEIYEYKFASSNDYNKVKFYAVRSDTYEIKEETTDKSFNQETDDGKILWLESNKSEQTPDKYDCGNWFYLLKFMNDGDVYKTIYQGEGLINDTKIPSDPTKPGQYFNGWSLDNGETLTNLYSHSVEKSETYISRWSGTKTKNTIYLQVKDASFGASDAEIYVYLYNSSTGEKEREWSDSKPGIPMRKVSVGTAASYHDVGSDESCKLYEYSYFIESGYDKVIFSRKDPHGVVWNQTQTADLSDSNDGQVAWLKKDLVTEDDKTKYKFGGWTGYPSHHVQFFNDVAGIGTEIEPTNRYGAQGATIISPDSPSKTKKVYKGWTQNGSDIVTPTTIGTTDLAYYPKWSNLYTVTFKKDLSDPSAISTHDYEEGSTIPAGDVPQNQTKFAYEWNGWTSNGSSVVTPAGQSVNADITYYGKWTARIEETYTVYVEVPQAWKQSGTFKVAVNMWDTRSGHSASGYPGTKAVHTRYVGDQSYIEASTKDVDYYSFTISTLYDRYQFTRITSDSTPTASNPKMETVAITVNKTEQEGKYLKLGGTSVQSDTTVYSIGSWNEYLDYTVTFKDDQNGNNIKVLYTDGQVLGSSFPTGLTKPGYHYSQWTDGTNNYSVGNISVTADKTLYPRWEQNPTYTITFKVNGSQYQQYTGKAAGEAMPIPPNPTVSNNYTVFKGWSTDGTEANIVNLSSLTVTGNATYQAVFVAKYYLMVFNGSTLVNTIAFNTINSSNDKELVINNANLTKGYKIKIKDYNGNWYGTSSSYSHNLSFTPNVSSGIVSNDGDYIACQTGTFDIYAKFSDSTYSTWTGTHVNVDSTKDIYLVDSLDKGDLRASLQYSGSDVVAYTQHSDNKGSAVSGGSYYNHNVYKVTVPSAATTYGFAYNNTTITNKTLTGSNDAFYFTGGSGSVVSHEFKYGETRTINLDTGGSTYWDQSNPAMFVHVWNSDLSADYQMTRVGSSSIFSVDIPSDAENIIFVRMKTGSDHIVWDDPSMLWNKTNDLTIPSDKDTYQITGWGGGDGQWKSPELEFNLTSNPGGWPTTNSGTLTNYTYTLNGVAYSFGLKNVKCNSGYLFCTATAVVGLPAISNKKLTKVVAYNTAGCSTSVIVGISSSASSASYITGGAAQTWSSASSSYTYNLSGTSINTVYYMYVTNKNAQITKLVLTYQ